MRRRKTIHEIARSSTKGFVFVRVIRGSFACPPAIPTRRESTDRHGYAVRSILLPAVHVPAGIYPLTFAEHKDLGNAAGILDPLAA